MEELLNFAEKELIKHFRDFGKTLQTFTETDLKDLGGDKIPGIDLKKYAEQDLKMTSEFVEEFSNFVEKWIEKDSTLLHPILQTMVDIMQAFMIGPGCFSQLPKATGVFLLEYIKQKIHHQMLHDKKIKGIKDTIQEEMMNDNRPNLTNIVGSDGKRMTIEELESEFTKENLDGKDN